MIPDEAVEAANEAVFRKFNGMMRPALVKVVLEAAAPHLMAPFLALADKWQEDFPDKARQIRTMASTPKETA